MKAADLISYKYGTAMSFVGTLGALALLAAVGCASGAQEANVDLLGASSKIQSGNDLQGGVDLARKATEADPVSAKAWYWLGYGLLAQKHYSEAIPALRKALDLGAVGDQYWSAAYSLGQCYIFTADYDSFQSLLKSAGTATASTAPSFNERGRLFLSAEMLGPAIQSFHSAIALDQKNPLYITNLADAVSRIDAKYTAGYRASLGLDMVLYPHEVAVEVGRWRNRMLIDAKDSRLPGILRNSKTEGLQALATKVEQTILDLTHNAEMTNDLAQRAEGSSPGSGEAAREIALVYRERIALLKPLLSSIRDEIENRLR